MDGDGRGFPPGDLRVSDADRDRALFELSHALQAGRITADEFDQRSGQALRTRTGRELTALLADLPLDRPSTARAALEEAQRVVTTRIAIGVAAVTAAILAATAAGNALSNDLSRQQLEFLRQMAARHGLPVPPGLPPSPGFNWPATITPGAVAVLLVVLIIYLRVRLARIDRSGVVRRTAP